MNLRISSFATGDRRKQTPTISSFGPMTKSLVDLALTVEHHDVGDLTLTVEHHDVGDLALTVLTPRS